MRGSGLRALCLAFMLSALWWPRPADAAQIDTSNTLLDFPVPNGYFYSEAGGGDPSVGYTVTNDGGVGLWDTFQRLGGVDSLGYPSSGRFMWNGFVNQATQKTVLQWNPAKQQADLVNVFDVLEQRGLDGWLQSTRQIPPSFDNGADAGKSWDQVVARHLAELDANTPIKARYLADPDPLDHFGLPQSYADEGNVLVLRCQRVVFQQWKEDVPWANAGDVTIANGGDIAKEAHLVPPNAITPVSSGSQVIAPLGRTLPLSPDQVLQVRAAAQVVLPSLVRVVSDLGGGESSLGSGIVIDSSGVILTNAHVVEGAQHTIVITSDGRVLTAQVAGADSNADIAVLRVQASGLKAAVRGDSKALRTGSVLVAIGYSDYFPTPPAVRVGQVTGLLRNGVGGQSIDYIRSTEFLLPGDSGGPLVNLQGQVVGVDTAIRLSVSGPLSVTGYSISLASALPVASHIITTTSFVAA